MINNELKEAAEEMRKGQEAEYTHFEPVYRGFWFLAGRLLIIVGAFLAFVLIVFELSSRMR